MRPSRERDRLSSRVEQWHGFLPHPHSIGQSLYLQMTCNLLCIVIAFLNYQSVLTILALSRERRESHVAISRNRCAPIVGLQAGLGRLLATFLTHCSF